MIRVHPENVVNKDNTLDKCPAANVRFGATAAVTRPKVCANLEVFRPSERQWKPRLRQAAGTLYVSGESVVEKVSRLEK